MRPGACVPASIQMLDDRLKTDETAISDEKTLITQLQTQLQASDSHTRQLSLLLSLMAGAVGLLVVVLIALGLKPKRRTPVAATPAPTVPNETPTQPA